MGVTTWSFEYSVQGWTANDDQSTGTGVGTMAHNAAAESLRATMSVSGGFPGNQAVLTNVSPTSLGLAVQAADMLEWDYSATSDGKNTGNTFIATFTDTTTIIASSSDSGAGTLTINFVAAKTLDYITAQFDRIGDGVANNFTRDVLEIRLTTAAAVAPTAGKIRLPSTFLGAGSGGFGNIADISPGGTYVYIAGFNNLGFPTLIRIAATLTADGTVVFEPMAGGRIGVQAANYNTQHVWVAGSFDSTNTIEKSEDYGASFAVKDPGTFGEIRTFEVGPDSDNRIIVFDSGNSDIIESLDGGTSWTTRNASVTPVINTIARFGQNPQETVFGNVGAANDSIDYSVNSGADLEDYQTGVYPATDASKVIAN